MIIKSFPLIIILILFIAAFAMPFIKSGKLVKTMSVVSIALGLILSIRTAFYVLREGKFYYSLGYFNGPVGMEFYIGNIEAIMGVVFTFVSLMIVWYSVYGINKEIGISKISLYYLLINILVGSLLGVVYTNDLFNGFIFIEVLILASCGIVVVQNQEDNKKATIKYLIMSCLGSGLVLIGITLVYSITGQLNIDLINKELINVYSEHPRIILISLSLFTIGLGVKSATFPLHTWLPDAYSSAPPSSRTILSALVLKAPVVLLIKVLYRTFGMGIIGQLPVMDIILILGSLSMIMGSVFAIFQKEIKRMVAYSSVAQMGYVFLGIGFGTEFGVTIAIFHMIGHAVTKSVLCLSVGAMVEKTGSNEISGLRGIGKEMPITSAMFVLGALSMTGIPLLPGFVSKWNLALASIGVNKVLIVGVILVSSLLNAAHYFPIIINFFFGEENLQDKVYKAKAKPIKELLPIICLVVAMIYIGFASGEIISLIKTSII